MRSLEGGRMAWLRAGTHVRSIGYFLARRERMIVHDDTNANCMSVSVTGFGRAVRIALEEVLENIDTAYHTMHRRMSVGDNGAFNASAISCALWLTLARLVRIVRIASPKLFCLPCPRCCCIGAPLFVHRAISLFGSHLTFELLDVKLLLGNLCAPGCCKFADLAKLSVCSSSNVGKA